MTYLGVRYRHVIGQALTCVTNRKQRHQCHGLYSYYAIELATLKAIAGSAPLPSRVVHRSDRRHL